MRAPSRVAASLVAILFMASGLAACVPTEPPVDLSRCATPAAGEIRVAVVVDSTTITGGSSTPSVVCVLLPTGSDGLDALTARSARTGTTAPRLGSSGFVCGIDGLPAAPACGELGPDGYEYWGYYWGGAAWDFASTGPASRILSDGDVEGWAFQNGSNGGEPRTPSSFTALTGS